MTFLHILLTTAKLMFVRRKQRETKKKLEVKIFIPMDTAIPPSPGKRQEKRKDNR